MPKLARIASAVVLLSSPIWLTGCQHPVGQFTAAPEPPRGRAMIFASSGDVIPCAVKVALPKTPESRDASLVAAAQPESSTVQLGDDFARLLGILRNH